MSFQSMFIFSRQADTLYAPSCVSSLLELEPYLEAGSLLEELRQMRLGSSVQVVVATNCMLKQAIALDHFCHRTGSAFIRADVRGVFASIFCDFGPNHMVLDVDGEPLHLLMASLSSSQRP